MTQLEITGQLILDLFKIVVHCLNRQATSVHSFVALNPWKSDPYINQA